MNKTDDLIESLAQAGAAPAASPLARFVTPLLLAVAVCALGVSLALDGAFAPMQRDGAGPLLVKWGFSGALVLLSAIALWVLGKPGRASGKALGAVFVPFALIAVMLAAELVLVGSNFPGATWRLCLMAMGAMSPVAFGGAIMAARWLAPTHLRRAGLAAGLFGGAVAMSAYAPFCPEHGIAYLAVFYCLPILAMAGLGWILGPRLLRW